MRLSILFLAILFVTCTKENKMSEPLKAVPSFSVNGKVITLTADKSTGDVCAIGWEMAIGSPQGANVAFNPMSSIQGDKNPKRDEPGQPYYISGTLQLKPITATVDKLGTYVFRLQVLDANRNESWAEINVEVK